MNTSDKYKNVLYALGIATALFTIILTLTSVYQKNKNKNGTKGARMEHFAAGDSIDVTMIRLEAITDRLETLSSNLIPIQKAKASSEKVNALYAPQAPSRDPPFTETPKAPPAALNNMVFSTLGSTAPTPIPAVVSLPHDTTTAQTDPSSNPASTTTPATTTADPTINSQTSASLNTPAVIQQFSQPKYTLEPFNGLENLQRYENFATW